MNSISNLICIVVFKFGIYTVLIPIVLSHLLLMSFLNIYIVKKNKHTQIEF